MTVVEINSNNLPEIVRPFGCPGCFAAVSVFDHGSKTCRACVCFDACDDQCLNTFDGIKGAVDVSAMLKRHEAGRKKLGRVAKILTSSKQARVVAPAPSISTVVHRQATPSQPPHNLTASEVGDGDSTTEIDLDRQLAALLAEQDDRKSLEIPVPSQPADPATTLIEQKATTPVESQIGSELDDSYQMQEARDVITKARDTAKAEVSAPARRPPEAVKSRADTSIGAETTAAPTLASAETDEEAAKDLVADYYFPACTIYADFSFMTHTNLVNELESLIDQVKQPNDYLEIRVLYCALAKELNRRGLLAPAFRSDLTIPWKSSDRKSAHTIIQRDRIVIDCHWLYSKKYKIKPTEKVWRNLFKAGTEFPFELAADFAARIISNEYRADALLGLTPFMQFQLRALRGKGVQEQIKSISQYRRVDGKRIPSFIETANLAINRWCEKDRRVEPHKDKYMAHARASALLSISSPTKAEIGQLAGMIQGVDALSESSVHSTLTKLGAKLFKSA